MDHPTLMRDVQGGVGIHADLGSYTLPPASDKWAQTRAEVRRLQEQLLEWSLVSATNVYASCSVEFLFFTDTAHATDKLSLDTLLHMWQGDALARLDLPPILVGICKRQICITGTAEADDLEHLANILRNSPPVSHYTMHVVSRYCLPQIQSSIESARSDAYAWEGMTKEYLQLKSARIRSRRNQRTKRDQQRRVPRWTVPRGTSTETFSSGLSFIHITQEDCHDYIYLTAQEMSIVDKMKHKGKGMPKQSRASHGARLVNVLGRSPRLLSYIKNNFHDFRKSLLLAIALAESDIMPGDGPGSHRTALLRHIRELFVYCNNGEAGEAELQRYQALVQRGRRPSPKKTLVLVSRPSKTCSRLLNKEG